MGPKKGAGGGGGGGKEDYENQWRTVIEQSQLNDQDFEIKVVVIECAGSQEDRLYLNKFENFAVEERRFVIKNICKTETTFMVNQLGGEKKVKDASLRVFEEGQAFLKEKKDIPPDIQSLIIKHLIMKMKEEYLFIKRQRLEVREGLRRESATMIDKAEVRGAVSLTAAAAATETLKKPKKGTQDPEIPEPVEGKKYNTTLRARGEEWRDKVYVDDFPLDGPNLYVALTGFVDPLLPVNLIRIGIPLTAIVQVRIDATATRVPSSLLKTTKRGQSQTEILMEKSFKFWEDLQQLRIHREYADFFKSTAFIIFYPPYWDTDKLTGNADKIYDELCYLMYDVQDLSRQHLNYLENLDLIHVPEDAVEEMYVGYSQNIDDLPVECVTIYSILDSMLQTVAKRLDFDEKSKSSLSTAVPYNQPENPKCRGDVAENFVNQIFNTLCRTELDKKKYRLTYGEEYETHKDPVIIKYGDFAKYTTFHLGNINLDNIVGATLFGMPINKLWQNIKQLDGETEVKLNFHINVLLSCFERDDVETAELNRMLQILSCRKLYNNRSSLIKKHLMPSTITEFKKVYLKRSILAEPLSRPTLPFKNCSILSPSFPSISKSENISDPSQENVGENSEEDRIKYLFDCPDISELVSAAEIANNKPIDHMVDDFEYFEDFTGISAFQIILDAFNKFNCVDYKFCEVTDCIILMFFNSHDKDGISREEWRCHLATPLCLQDFFDFILEEHYQWIQEEEKLYDERMGIRSPSEAQASVDTVDNVTCLEDADVGTELLMEGSLKHQETLQVEEEEVPETFDKSTGKKTTTYYSPTSTDQQSSRKTPVSTLKGKAVGVTSSASDENEGSLKKPFCGYDLGDRRVEVIGKDSTYFSNDGTLISSKYTLLIPMNLEYIILNVVPGNGNNEFWVHKALGEFTTLDIIERCESFRVTTKDQVMININKRSYQLPLPPDVYDVKFNSKTNGESTDPNDIVTEQLFETKFLNSLYVTWPNGLVTESIHAPLSADVLYIKQHHIVPLTSIDENKRCVSLDGDVIIFKCSGNIEVVRPDGTYMNITKCETRPVGPVETVQAPGEKFVQGAKSKQSKSSVKSSKVTTNLTIDDKTVEYDLFFDEFEVIETNGLRQNWISNIPYDIEKLLIRTATDYCLGEVFSRRMDGTTFLYNKDGVQIVTFPNKTRIITNLIIEDHEIYPEWTDEEKEYFEMFNYELIDTVRSKGSMSQTSTMSKKVEEEELKVKEKDDSYVSVQVIYTIEHPNFATITINKSDGSVSVTSPNSTTVTVSNKNNYELILDSVTSATFDGEDLRINYEACPKCKSYTKCDIKLVKPKIEVTGNPDIPDIEQSETSWLRMQDSFSKNIIVNREGNITLSNEPCIKETEIPPRQESSMETNQAEPIPVTEEEGTKNEYTEDKPDARSEGSVTSHSKCRGIYQAKTVRFFILRRDLTCSELLHRSLVDQYNQLCRWQPWCSIGRYDIFGDHRTLLSVLTPVNVNASEKWLMDSKLANKPKYITFKDLKQDPGKGFYHWMRPYEKFEPCSKKPDNVLPPRLPKAFVLRTLEHQWPEAQREELKGAKELLNAVLRYRVVIASDSETLLHIPVVDLRSEDDRRIDDLVQAVGHRIYNDLKARLQFEIECNAKASITTKPMPPHEEMSLSGEIEESICEKKMFDEERANMVKDLEQAEEMSPNLERYWRRRAEELKEEQFYQYLLREGSVPPYFRNILGGAIWWDMNNTAAEAVTSAERRKMKCPCAPEERSTGETTRASDALPPLGFI